MTGRYFDMFAARLLAITAAQRFGLAVAWNRVVGGMLSLLFRHSRAGGRGTTLMAREIPFKILHRGGLKLCNSPLAVDSIVKGETGP